VGWQAAFPKMYDRVQNFSTVIPHESQQL